MKKIRSIVLVIVAVITFVTFLSTVKAEDTKEVAAICGYTN